MGPADGDISNIPNLQRKTALQMNIDCDLVPRLLAPAFVLRAPLVVLLLSIGEVVFAQAPAMAEDHRMLPYAEPGQRVDIGGRRINMHCAGTGTPTVILMAGLFSWSVVWYKTQPVIAQKTRVCAFDRAGYGFSDPAPKPQIDSEVVEDLRASTPGGIYTRAVCAGWSLLGRHRGATLRRALAEGGGRHGPRRYQSGRRGAHRRESARFR